MYILNISLHEDILGLISLDITGFLMLWILSMYHNSLLFFILIISQVVNGKYAPDSNLTSGTKTGGRSLSRLIFGDRDSKVRFVTP